MRHYQNDILMVKREETKKKEKLFRLWYFKTPSLSDQYQTYQSDRFVKYINV